MGRRAWLAAQSRKQAELRSHLEDAVKRHLGDQAEYEPFTIGYVSRHDYTPDFVIERPQTQYLIEVKGFFRDKPEAAKYKWIAEQIEEYSTNDGRMMELVFVFENPTKRAYPGLRKRKDGTYFTQADWATKHGFRYFSVKEKNIDQIWRLP